MIHFANIFHLFFINLIKILFSISCKSNFRARNFLSPACNPPPLPTNNPSLIITNFSNLENQWYYKCAYCQTNILSLVFPRGGYSHTWAWYGDSAVMTPVFEIYPHHELIDPLIVHKTIGLSLSHLVPEILGPKVGLIFFTKM